MSKSRIIVLNGTSSAGKTTLARAIQAFAAEPFQLISFDQFRDGLPSRFRGLNSPTGSPGSRGLNVVAKEANGSHATLIQLGEHGLRVVEGMHQAIATIATAGQNVVVDHFINHVDVALDIQQVLRPFNPLYVGVYCELEELRRRESNRPGRFPGTAEAQRPAVYDCMNFHIQVDTTSTPASEISKEILNHYHLAINE